MGLVSLEQQRQRELADAQAKKIMEDLRAYDLARSRCPVDRRRAEKEAERRAQEAREVKEQHNQSDLMAAVEHRIGQWFTYYFMGWDTDDTNAEPEHRFGHCTWGLTQHLGDNRREERDWVKQQIEDERRNFEARIAELEARLKSSPGKLPVAKTWQPESVTYQAEMVSHKGSLWQAKRDTAQRPGGEDWVLIARHGRDAVTPVVRGAFDLNDSYAALDIVTFDGAAYIAKHADPGLCPGEGWEPLSRRGQRGRKGEAIRGPQGEKGAKGDKGDYALEIVSWHIDPVNYRAIPFMSNGKPGKPLELRALFERFIEEVGAT